MVICAEGLQSINYEIVVAAFIPIDNKDKYVQNELSCMCIGGVERGGNLRDEACVRQRIFCGILRKVSAKNRYRGSKIDLVVEDPFDGLSDLIFDVDVFLTPVTIQSTKRRC